MPTLRSVGLGFVVVTRVSWLLAAIGLALPVIIPVALLKRYLPRRQRRFHFPRLARARDVIVQWLLTARDWLKRRSSAVRAWVGRRLPPWVDHRRAGIILLKTDRGMARLDMVVDRIPDATFERWRRFAVQTMEVFVIVWGAILLAYLGVSLWLVGKLVIAAGEWVLTADWAALMQSGAPPQYNPGSVPSDAAAVWRLLVRLAAGVVTAIVILWAIMLPLLPGLTLHEFGHYAALRKAGASVDGYGLLLIGPVLGGAFVEPGSDAALLDRDDTFGVWAGGIANSLIWGTVLLVAGLAAGGDAVRLFELYTAGDISGLLSQPAASLLLAVGAIEVANGFLNAVPLGPVDGGGYIRSVEREWWGFHGAIDAALRGGDTGS